MKLRLYLRLGYSILVAACIAYSLKDREVGVASLVLVTVTWTMARILSEGLEALVALGTPGNNKEKE